MKGAVAEYWIVKPESHEVEGFALEGREYRRLGEFSGQQTLPTPIVPGLPVRVEQFFV